MFWLGFFGACLLISISIFLLGRLPTRKRVQEIKPDYSELERQQYLRDKSAWEREFKTLLVNSQFRTQRDIDNEKAWDQQMTIEQFMNHIGYKIENHHD